MTAHLPSTPHADPVHRPEAEATGCPAFAQVRRRDRAVEDEAWIGQLLRRSPVGTLAMVEDGQPMVNTNIFVFEAASHAIYLHTARRGRTPDRIAEDPAPVPATFTAFEMGRLLPSDEAVHFSTEYASVVVTGTITPLRGADALRALDLLMAKYAPHLTPGDDYRPADDRDLARTQVGALRITSWSGKRKAADEAFAGAYRFEELCLPRLVDRAVG